MASKFASLLRKRRVLLIVVSAVAALLSAKSGGIHSFGFWDGPI
ncbi:MAG TPA: hypothetical protein VGL84_01285 [Gaiellaceae bacterium]